jgi:putative transposase
VRFRFIDAEKASFPVKDLCRVLRVRRSGYYAWQSRDESERTKANRRLSIDVRAVFKQHRGRYGSPRISQELGVCRHRVARLMREERLRARPRRRFCVTTDSRHSEPVPANIVARNFEPTEPNRVWAGDVTYLATGEGWLFLAVLLDLFSRRVVGLATSEHNDEQLTLSALHMAIEQRQPDAGIIHHSDRGTTYAAGTYQDVLREHEFVASMSRKGNCWDNAVVESFFSTLDFECAEGKPFATRAVARRAVTDYVLGYYNPTRLHSYLGYRSPMEFEKTVGL